MTDSNKLQLYEDCYRMSEWERCLEVATLNCVSKQLRALFAILLVHANVTDPKVLFYKFLEHMADDFIYLFQQQNRELGANDPVILAHVANDIETHLSYNSKSWNEFDLPDFDAALVENLPQRNHLINEETSYDREELTRLAANVQRLNNDQRAAFNRIVSAVQLSTGESFFVDGPDGHGKTFLFNTIIGHLRQSQQIVLAVASSGIASLLLLGGRTAHSRFKIPLDILPESTCNIEKNSNLGELIRQTSLIIWDEAPMCHRHALEALDRTLKDIRDDERNFGGVIIVFGGDFRQTLPVVNRGSRARIIDACIKKSSLWDSVQILSLRHNMRLDQESQNRSEFLLQVGDGKAVEYPDIGRHFIRLPDELCETQSLDDLIDKIYGDITSSDLSDRAILTPKNVDVTYINNTISHKYDRRQTHTFKSADSVELDDPSDHVWPVEFLNSLEPNGIPPYELVLAIGMPIVLLRNLYPSQGLCNGTCL